MIALNQLKKDVAKLRSPRKAEILARFFKTGPGEYGEGDHFLGLTMPQQRQVAKKYPDLSFDSIQKLLNIKIHEYRIIALLILMEKYRNEKEKSVRLYLKNTQNINNWDLVDLSAPKILGDYLLNKDKKILYQLARSKTLWERRMAILATFAFIHENQFADTLKIAEILLNDDHDLVHKAVGWMLREVGKRNQQAEERFLLQYYRVMPRVMLRYTVEKFSTPKKQFYLAK